MGPSMGLSRSTKNKEEKMVPPRQDFAGLEALQAHTLWLGQSWHRLKRGENSP